MNTVDMLSFKSKKRGSLDILGMGLLFEIGGDVVVLIDVV